MATSIAQCCFLLSRCSSYTRLILRSVKPGTVYENTLFRHSIHQTIAYGNRGADLRDSQVDIPVDRLTVSYSRSSGPGGQHVNKVNTKAEVRFHVRTADWIPEDIQLKIIEKNKGRINKAGELLVTSELSRSQHRNFDDCIQKICNIIAEASEKPHKPTAEDIALRAARLEKRNKERLKLKKIHSATKQNRRVDFD